MAKTRSTRVYWFEPYDILQILARDKWSDYATIRDPIDASYAKRKVDDATFGEYRIVRGGDVIYSIIYSIGPNLNDSRSLLVKKGLLPERAQNESNLGAALHDLETGGKLTRRQTDAFDEIVCILTRAVPNRRLVEEPESVT